MLKPVDVFISQNAIIRSWFHTIFNIIVYISVGEKNMCFSHKIIFNFCRWKEYMFSHKVIFNIYVRSNQYRSHMLFTFLYGVRSLSVFMSTRYWIETFVAPNIYLCDTHVTPMWYPCDILTFLHVICGVGSPDAEHAIVISLPFSCW